MRLIIVLACIFIACSCATDDAVSKRRHGQQLVCHKGHTQAVTTGDFFVHQNHGDSIGPCPEDQ